jgi:hypothetical protein
VQQAATSKAYATQLYLALADGLGADWLAASMGWLVPTMQYFSGHGAGHSDLEIVQLEHKLSALESAAFMA